MIGTTIDKYHIREKLGKGNFGDVYLCYDPFLEKEIAVKVIKAPDPEKFVTAVKEGQVLDVCRHNHIVVIKDVTAVVYNNEVVVIIIMEYLSAGSVQGLIEARFVPVQESCKIMQQALLGLEHAHNSNILHRDIKPGNILIGNRGESKLSDFGLAINYHTILSDMAGYMPHQPLEVIEGNPMDKLSDIYAVGITFYRLLNNLIEIRFEFSLKEDWLKAVKKDEFPPRIYLPHIPDKILKILNKAIHKNKSSRYKNCSEFRQAIEKLKFNINWKYSDYNNWTGIFKKDIFSLKKIRKNGFWTIEFKKNGIRNNAYCYKNILDDDIEKIFFRIISDTTLI